MVIAMGGGSALDTGKAVAALLPNPGELTDFLEVVGKGRQLFQPSLPLAAIPTTAGTGAEVTRNAVLMVPQERVKVSLRGPSLLPRLAIVDPELTYDAPRDVTAYSGMDALVQLIEPFLSAASNPMIDALCRDGIPRIARSIRIAYGNGTHAEARGDMALAALFSGMALANAKLGAVHGFAGPIGGLFMAPHGAICARLLPVVMETNLNALRKRESQSDRAARFDELGWLLTGDGQARAEDACAWIRTLCGDLAIPPLHTYGMIPADFEEIVARSRRSSSMKGNPVPLTDAELTAILEQAL